MREIVIVKVMCRTLAYPLAQATPRAEKFLQTLKFGDHLG
jgi:hypothetical protein